MSIWIVTTGNSDIQLNNDDNWWELYKKVRSEYPLSECNYFGDISNKDEETGLFLVPARVLGLVYGNQSDYYSDLEFPLLDVFKSFYKNDRQGQYPSKVIVLLTDQANIFQDEIEYKKCAYWQDTCTLEPLFIWYFTKNLNIEPIFKYIKPPYNEETDLKRGIDHWGEMFQVVKNTLEKCLSEGNLSSNETVYVSHQAGTPAISSALVRYFSNSNKFNRVRFLVSNKYYNYDNDEWQYDADLIY